MISGTWSLSGQREAKLLSSTEFNPDTTRNGPCLVAVFLCRTFAPFGHLLPSVASFSPPFSMSAPQKPHTTKHTTKHTTRHTTKVKKTVSTLSPEQLERKRANDREAQRIIRENTRKHIEGLEQQIAQFDDKEQLLRKAILRNSQLEAQVAALQDHIAGVMATFQYWQSHCVGGRNDTDGTGSWHPAPTASSNTRNIN